MQQRDQNMTPHKHLTRTYQKIGVWILSRVFVPVTLKVSYKSPQSSALLEPTNRCTNARSGTCSARHKPTPKTRQTFCP